MYISLSVRLLWLARHRYLVMQLHREMESYAAKKRGFLSDFCRKRTVYWYKCVALAFTYSASAYRSKFYLIFRIGEVVRENADQIISHRQVKDSLRCIRDIAGTCGHLLILFISLYKVLLSILVCNHKLYLCTYINWNDVK